MLTAPKVTPLRHLLLGRRATLRRGAAPTARPAAHRRGAHRCRAAPLHRLAQALAGVCAHPRAVELARRVRRVAQTTNATRTLTMTFIYSTCSLSELGWAKPTNLPGLPATQTKPRTKTMRGLFVGRRARPGPEGAGTNFGQGTCDLPARGRAAQASRSLTGPAARAPRRMPACTCGHCSAPPTAAFTEGSVLSWHLRTLA